MTRNRLLSRVFTAAALSAAAFLPLGAAQAADTYVTLPQALPSDTSGKTEVLEFFSYSCPHCAILEPKVAAWAKTLPEDVVVRPVPVAFNAGMADLQKLYYTLVALERSDLHGKVFEAIHQQRQPIFNQKEISKWVAGQGVDQAKFDQTFNSFGIQTKVTKANELARAYMIEGTPSLAVGGLYVTSPAMAKGYDETVQQAQALLQKLGK